MAPKTSDQNEAQSMKVPGEDQNNKNTTKNQPNALSRAYESLMSRQLPRTLLSSNPDPNLYTPDQISQSAAYFARKRASKVADKNQHFATPGNSHKAKGSKSECSSISVSETRTNKKNEKNGKSKDKPEPPFNPKELSRKELIAYEESLQELFQVNSMAPNAYYEMPRTKQLVTKPLDLTPCEHPQGSIIKVAAHGFGWYAIAEDEQKNSQLFLVEPCTQVLTLEAFTSFTNGKLISRTKTSYSVITPIFAELKKKFPSSVRDIHLEKAVSAFAYTHPAPHGEAIQSTCDYFLELLSLRVSVMLERGHVENIVTNPLSPPIITSPLTSTMLKGLRFYDSRFPVTIPDVVLEQTEIDYLTRDDFTVVHKDKYGYKTDQFESFENNLNGTRHTTLYGKLSYKEVSVYADCNSNQIAGAYRIIGAKEVDENLPNTTLDSKLLRQNSLAMMRNVLLYRRDCDYVERDCFNKVCRVILGNRTLGELTPIPATRRGDTDVDFGAPLLPPTSESNSLAEAAGQFLRGPLQDYIARCGPTTVQYYTDSLINAKLWVYHSVWEATLGVMGPFVTRELAANIAHLKKAQRIRYVAGEPLHTDENMIAGNISIQTKREVAKAFKRPRLFASYGKLSMYASQIPEYMKIGINGYHYLELNGYTCVIHILSKPKADTINEIFPELIAAQTTHNHVHIVIFSDDSCAAGRIDGLPFACNLDIASNDSHQDGATFLTTYLCMANFCPRAALGLIKQCSNPLRMYNVGGEGYNEIKFEGVFEGSGSVLTTVLNHTGSFINCVLGFFMLANGVSSKTAFQCGAALNGHELTVDWCERVEDFQFLKRFPVAIGDNKFIAAMGLGAILRRFGLVDQDLTATRIGVTQAKFGSMSHDEIFDRYQSSIIMGWKHEPSNPILDALRKRYSSAGVCEVKHDSNIYIFSEDTDNSQHDSTEACRLRYGITSEEEAEIVEAITTMRVGFWYDLEGVNKILRKDYGM